jgi:hypothetical protein
LTAPLEVMIAWRMTTRIINSIQQDIRTSTPMGRFTAKWLSYPVVCSLS